MPLVSQQIYAQISERAKIRFARRLVRSGDCLVFSGTKNARGYGLVDVRLNKRRHAILAHRLAWMMANGRDVADGKIICHRCHNPSCCNPRHLYEGTHKTNNDDMVRAGRHKSSKPWAGVSGEAHPMAKYKDATRALVISMIERGEQPKRIAHKLRIPVATIRLWWRNHVKARTQAILDS